MDADLIELIISKMQYNHEELMPNQTFEIIAHGNEMNNKNHLLGWIKAKN